MGRSLKTWAFAVGHDAPARREAETRFAIFSWAFPTGGRLIVNSNPIAGAARLEAGVSGEPMSQTQTSAPTREDFAALLNETYGDDEAFEGSVVKGRVVAIEKDMAVIDVGLKTEGRVALKEFTNHGRDPAPGVGDEVEVYLERIENALGEAVISRDKARREESWGKLEKAFQNN